MGYTVALKTSPWEQVLRQSPGQKGVWGDYRFQVNEKTAACDFLVVCDIVNEPIRVVCPPSRTVFITWEPPSVRTYHRSFLRQFAVVISPHEDLDHPHVIRSQPAIPWNVGFSYPGGGQRISTLNYDGLASMEPPVKSRKMSIVCSNKAMTEGHRQRLRMLEGLQREFGSDLDVFGNGFRPIDNKWDAVVPYEYHVALENSEVDDYWSEKLADVFLGYTFPIYGGCTNIGRYFGAECMRTVSRLDVPGAIETIRGVLREDIYQRAMPALKEARRAILDRYNLFPMLETFLGTLAPSEARGLTVLPEMHWTEPFRSRLKRRVKACLGR